MFSRFVRMLDIIETCIGEDKREGGAGLRLCRIDGGHSDLERQHTIARFNKNEKISVCLVRCVAVPPPAGVDVVLGWLLIRLFSMSIFVPVLPYCNCLSKAAEKRLYTCARGFVWYLRVTFAAADGGP